MKRILLYLAFAFIPTWLYWFGVSYPLAQEVNGGLASSSLLQLSIAPAMFFPAIAVVLTRLITREGFKPAFIFPVAFKKTWKFWLLGWFGPSFLVLAGAAVYFILNPNDFTLDDALMITTSFASAGMTDVSAEQIHALIAVQLGVGIFGGTSVESYYWIW